MLLGHYIINSLSAYHVPVGQWSEVVNCFGDYITEQSYDNPPFVLISKLYIQIYL